MREHRMCRLDERLSAETPSLRGTCRYQSDITTAPPYKRVALTFDDGPQPGNTEAILATLRRHGIPASFFLVGERVARHPELVAAIVADGHHRAA